MSETGESNLLWATLLIEELRRHGVDHFGVAPGSRSSPLAMAVARNERVQSTVHFDERGLGFHALGFLRGCGRPAAIICTSGTAAANFYPAVVEASMDRLPLIALTADRPPELRNCGANQTIDQLHLYGDYARFFADLPCPDPAGDPGGVLSIVDDAVHSALGSPSGPVHLNCPFREPLLPATLNGPNLSADLQRWYDGEVPLRAVAKPEIALDADSLKGLIGRLGKAQRGLIIVGQLSTDAERISVASACRRLGWPVLADITSGLRTAEHDLPCGPHEPALHSPEFRKAVRPDFIMRIGGQLVSKHLLALLAENKGVECWQVSGKYFPFDPAHVATRRLSGEIETVARMVAESMPPSHGSDYAQLWQGAYERLDSLVEDSCRSARELNEISLIRRLAETMDGDHLFVASSLPIRDFDCFIPRACRIGAIAANRGASGIDGTVASAAGFALGLSAPVTLVTGDLALLHDLNSLALIARSPHPVTIVTINNNGGRIFETLPVAAHREYFERYFAASHDLHFGRAAAMFGLDYARADTLEAFAEYWKAARASGRSGLIEAVVDPEPAAVFRRKLVERLAQAAGG